MRPLPRLHAITDARILSRADLADRAARMADSAGPALAIHVRAREIPGRELLARAVTLAAIAAAAECALFVNGRADVAALVGAHGVQLGQGELAPAEARTVLGTAWGGWIGVSVHSTEEARDATAAGADCLLLGNIFETRSHPGRPGLGAEVIRVVAGRGLPVIAIGGVTAERVPALRAAGAWGVASISSLWDAADPAAATLALLTPWLDAA